MKTLMHIAPDGYYLLIDLLSICYSLDGRVLAFFSPARSPDKPSAGPIASSINTNALFLPAYKWLISWMLMMVIKKPILVVMVSEVPLDFSGAFCATSVEKSGESATTAIPQQKRKIISSHLFGCVKKYGDSKQQQPDRANAMAAIFFDPNLADKIPPAIQDSVPDPITKKEIRGIFKWTAGKCCRYVSSITGTKTQKA